jgi:hypothetical protein|tara:strand:+ start:199 stop:504 length:306 start_codon:yes stop_codon:yes gene_type:complete
MSVRTAARIVGCIIVVGVVLAGVLLWNGYLRADSGVIELTKSESLALMNAQSSFVLAQADRDELLRALLFKYKISLETHTINIKLGQFVPLQSEKIDEEAN